MKYLVRALTIMAIIAIIGCTKINSSQIVYTEPCRKWGIAALTNNTEIPQAGNRAMSITAGVLRSKGVKSIAVYPSNVSCSKLIVCPNSSVPIKNILAWARQHHLSYVIGGSVNEWDYKVGLDGEPAVAVSLQVYHVKSSQLIWSSVGSKIGTSRSGLGVIAQELITEMLRTLKTA